jgi:hypothetical protein
VPEIGFLMVDGEGDPASDPAYTEAVEALFAMAYGCKFHLKRTAGIDFTVGPLEGLWSTGATGDVWTSRGRWRWTIMIAQPDAVTPEVVEEVVDAVAANRRANASVPRVRLERFAEGQCAQLLHVGPYGEAERPSLEALHRFIAESGMTERGRHHEIYLSDARRTAPERLRTILRHPVT